jgi:hypothetical protein
MSPSGVSSELLGREICRFRYPSPTALAANATLAKAQLPSMNTYPSRYK